MSNTSVYSVDDTVAGAISGVGENSIPSGSPRGNLQSAAAEDVQPSSRGFDFSVLPRLLRALGGATLIASISIFLLQGWEDGNDIFRYLLLLGHSVALTAIGFASGHFLKESKGARLLVTLALASVPANFAILGAFVFSQWSAGAISLPQFVVWQVDSWAAALTTLGAALVFLLPMTVVGFMVLARKSALPLSTMFLAGNAMLLVPARDPISTALMMLVLAAITLWSNSRISNGDPTLRTWEGFVARLLQFAPVGVIFGRTAWLYSGDVFVFTAMSLIAFLVMRHVALMIKPGSKSRALIERASVPAALATSYGAVFCLESILPALVEQALLPLFAMIAAALVFEIGTRAANGGAAYRRLAAIFVALGLLVQLWVDGGVLTASLCLAAGLGVMVYGYTLEQKVVFGLGGLILAMGLVYQIHYAVTNFDLGSWGSLAVLGVAAIVAGSALERHGARLRAHVGGWKNRIMAWDY